MFRQLSSETSSPVNLGRESLRRAGAILLISCYELGHQPLGVALPLSFLQRSGYNPETLDISVQELQEAKIAPARFVGVSVPMHTALRLGVQVARRVREINSVCHICFYGLYATLNSDYLLDHWADSVIGGEIEGPLVQLVGALERGDRVPVPGVARRHEAAGSFLEKLSFPVPSRQSLPGLSMYARLEHRGEQRLVGSVEASRGCKHMCLHCPIPPVYGGRFFVVPSEVVLQDIRNLAGAGASHITFGDPDFLNGPAHSLRIVRAMHEELPEITFDFTAKVEHIVKYRALFPELSALGCLFVVSAVESLSDGVLGHLEKGHTRADVGTALEILRESRITLRPSLVSFTPWTTLDDYIDVLEFVENHGMIDQVDPVQYSIRLLVPPGSALLEQTAIRPFFGELDQASFLYPWIHSDHRMDLLYQEVSAIVEEAARLGGDPVQTFEHVREHAYRMRGDPVPAGVLVGLELGKSQTPRLTESWFC